MTPTSAQKLMKQLADVRSEVEGWHNLVKRIQDFHRAGRDG